MPGVADVAPSVFVTVRSALSVTRPSWLAVDSANHKLPSGVAVIPDRPAVAVIPAAISVIVPAGVIRPIWSTAASVNQSDLSGPATMPVGPAAAVGVGNSVTVPAGVIRP